MARQIKTYVSDELAERLRRYFHGRPAHGEMRRLFEAALEMYLDQWPDRDQDPRARDS